MQIKIEKEAAEFRNRMGYTSTDPIRLKSLLLKQNIITVFRPLSDHFSGMAVKTGDRMFILINSNHSIGRQHFSICHELYHLFIQKNFSTHHCTSGLFDKKNNEEYSADLFAAYLLMPKEGIISLIPDNELSRDKISMSTILKIEHYYSCSRSALLNRLKEINLISNNFAEQHKDNIIQTAKKFGYDNNLYTSGNDGLIIGDYGSLARKLYENEKISEGHYAELMSTIGFDVFNNGNDEEN